LPPRRPLFMAFSQLNAVLAGACKDASAPGLAFSSGGGGLDLLEEVATAGQQPPGDRHGGDLGAPAAGQLGVGAGKLRAALGRVGGLLQDHRTQGEPCLVLWPWRRLRSALPTAGVSPAQAHRLRAVGNRSMSPISATSVMAVSRPTPGRT
jgi:hypothetical protein